MVGYHKFLKLTLERWKRFVILQNLSPLLPKEKLEEYLSKFGPIERVRLIHNPGNGCYMRKALVLMKSESSATKIIRIKRHSVGTEEFFTAVEYKGSIRQYKHGRFKLYLIIPLPWSQKSVDDRSKMGYHLTREIVEAYHGYLFTSIKLDIDDNDFYSGVATVRFEFETDKERILERTKQKLRAGAIWTDTKDKNYNAVECLKTLTKKFGVNGKEVKDHALDEKVEDHVLVERVEEVKDPALDDKVEEVGALDEKAEQDPYWLPWKVKDEDW